MNINDVPTLRIMYLPDEKRHVLIDKVDYDENTNEKIFTFEKEVSYNGILTREIRCKGFKITFDVVEAGF